jgi:hypothetical protein
MNAVALATRPPPRPKPPKPAEPATSSPPTPNPAEGGEPEAAAGTLQAALTRLLTKFIRN